MSIRFKTFSLCTVNGLDFDFDIKYKRPFKFKFTEKRHIGEKQKFNRRTRICARYRSNTGLTCQSGGAMKPGGARQLLRAHELRQHKIGESRASAIKKPNLISRTESQVSGGLIG